MTVVIRLLLNSIAHCVDNEARAVLSPTCAFLLTLLELYFHVIASVCDPYIFCFIFENIILRRGP